MDLVNVFNSAASNAASAVSDWSKTGLSNMPDLINQFGQFLDENVIFASYLKAAQQMLNLVWVAFILLLLSVLLLKLVKVLAAVVKGTISAVFRHAGALAGTFVAGFVAGFLALMLHDNVETMEALKEAFNNLNG